MPRISPRMQNFYEFRLGLLGLKEFADAGLAFLDNQFGGMVPQKRTYTKRAEPTPAPPNPDALREKVKAHFKKKRGGAVRPSAKATPGVEPDGNHVTFSEAAEMLKMSEANVRLKVKAGLLSPPIFENRPRPNGAIVPTMVLLREAVEQFGETYQPNTKIQKNARRKRPKKKA